MKITLRTCIVVSILITSLALSACGTSTTVPAPVPTPVSVVQADAQGPTIEIGSANLNPDKTIDICAAHTVALTTSAEGVDLTYNWSVDGDGTLQRQGGKGDDGSSNRYTAPAIPGSQDILKLTVKDATGQSATDQIIVNIVDCTTPSPSAVPTPGPADTPITTETPGPATCSLISLRSPIVGPAAPGINADFQRPEDCSMDLPNGNAMQAGGSYSGDLAGRELWVLVYGPDGKYYPQTLDACQDPPSPSRASSGKWSTTIYLGSREPGQFDVVLTVASPESEASQTFETWLRNGCKTSDYPGFADLPNGLTELNAITVHNR